MRKKIEGTLLVFLTGLFVSGIYLPFIKTKKFELFNSSNSLLSSLDILYSEERMILFIILGLSTIVLPLIKILALTLKFLGCQLDSKVRGILAVLTKWSFIDVFVVAVYVVLQKQTWWYKLELGLGFYAFLSFGIITFFMSIVIRTSESKNVRF